MLDKQSFLKLHLRLIKLVGVIVPRRLRADWRQEWEAELHHHESLLDQWRRNRRELLLHSLGSLRDALLLQPKRLEDEMVQDLRYGIRLLLKTPAFTFVAVLTLALGIGANTTIFSVVNAVLLRPLNYKEADRLVQVWHRNVSTPAAQRQNIELTPANFLDLRAQNQVFKHLAAFVSHDFNLTGMGEPERLQGWQVSASLFPMLAVAPIAGRVFTEAEDRDGAEKVAVLSHELWQRRFGGQSGVIGSKLTLDDLSYTVVGVMPPGFGFPVKGAELWAPLAFSPDERNARSSFYLNGIARLKAGVTLEQTQAEMDAVAQRLELAHPKSNTGMRFHTNDLREGMVGNVKLILWVLAGAVGFVLLIACVNVANLLLARAAAREKELAVRAALGAGRLRLARQMLTESSLLALLGGTAGLLFAFWGLRALKAINPGTIARLDEVALDWRVLGFTFGLSLLAGLIFGLAPAMQISTLNLNQTLNEGGRESSGARSRRLRGLLVVAEVALSLVLLVGAGLLVRSFLRLQSVDLGFNPDRLLTMRVDLSSAKSQQLPQIVNFYQQVIEKVRALPGVESASVVNAAPIITPGMRSAIVIEDKPDPLPGQPMLANNRVISPDYFQTMKIPLLAGRALTGQDQANTPEAVVINQMMARRYWGDENPVGKRIKLGPRGSKLPWLTVAGVVGDIRQAGLSADPLPEFYTPFTQPHAPWARPRVLVIRAAGDPANLVSAMKSQIWSVDKDQPIFAIRTMEEILDRWLATRRFNMLLLGVFASLALVLAAVGIYGVISYTVSLRAREIGVRIALGASARDILRLVVGHGMFLTLLGVALGLAASFGLTRFLANLLFGVQPTDPLTFAGISLLLALVALAACYLPARRATKVDPLVVLRSE